MSLFVSTEVTLSSGKKATEHLAFPKRRNSLPGKGRPGGKEG